jgi:poly [ADP-ribose] polymerase
MFDKGVYFADSVSKSAQYCFSDDKNTTGVLLLCEVALGDIEERKQADYHASTTKGTRRARGCGV